LFIKACQLVYRFLRCRPRTEKEIVSYLEKKKKKYFFSETTIKKTVAFFKEEGEIDDRQFIDWFVKGRLRARPKSIFLLRWELSRLGIKKELMDNYFDQKQFDEAEIALKALRLKSRRWHGPQRENFVKMANFLKRRGFGGQLIKRAIAEFFHKE